MTDAASELYDLLVDNTGSGEALESLAGRIYRDEADFARSRDSGVVGMPVAWLRVGGAQPFDSARGSRWQVLRGTITITVAAEAASDDDDGWNAARESAVALVAGIERVLMSARWHSSDTYPLGSWCDLAFGSDGAETKRGPATVAGLNAWAEETDVRLTIRRYRAA